MLSRRAAAHGVRSTFSRSTILIFAYDVGYLQALLPPGLTVDSDGSIGFLAVAYVDSRSLRPAAVKREIGIGFRLRELLIFCSYTNRSGRRMNGLFLLGSSVSSGVAWIGSKLLTPYVSVEYRKLVIAEGSDRSSTTVSDRNALLIECSRLPEGQSAGSIDTSIFETWSAAMEVRDVAYLLRLGRLDEEASEPC